MPPTDLPLALWVVLGLILLGLLMIGLGQLRTGARLRAIERRLSAVPMGDGDPARAEARSERGDQESNLLFDEFLEEEPSRRRLAKKEQFAAFRKWRRDKGLNWGG